jgi:diguanylate cyclase (GGDEF)-like protein
MSQKIAESGMSEPYEVTIATLRTLEALRGIGDETLEALIGRTQCIRVEPGHVLLKRDESNTRMFAIVSGLLRVDLQEDESAPIARLTRGDTVGEMSLLARNPASANVTAEQPSCLLVIDEETFFWLIGISHAFSVTLLVRLANRLRKNNEAVEANIVLRREFEQAALHDPLTGTHSRRWLDGALPRLFQRHRFSGEPLCLIVLDVDHFKRINDTFGHPAGDSVLAAVGRLIGQKLRPTDLVARFGGEEFVLLLPHTALPGGVRAAERLREAIAVAPMSHGGDALPGITVSMGVAALGPSIADPAQLLALADRALYVAKTSGRNQTRSAQAVEGGGLSLRQTDDERGARPEATLHGETAAGERD